MRARLPLAATAAILAAVTAWLLPSWSAGSPDDAATGPPLVCVEFPERPFTDLFPARREDDDGSVPVAFTDTDGTRHAAKASLRGFSAWHHGATKPSLRIKHKAAGGARASPEFVQLSRPEDPFGICNWLPDQLAKSLGLLHEHSQHVRLHLDGRNAGLYLRSLRPGDDLAAAAGRARGTFWKGDCLGDRAHLDLWTDAGAWRATGAVDAEADHHLRELLEALRAPADAASLDRLAAVLDLEAAARQAALAVLVGSIHADRVHNHVWFFDPARARIEPLLWDANGFGIHAGPDLQVEVARHPLAERLLCAPRFVHRRNEILFDLLRGAGSAAALGAAIDAHLDRLGGTLFDDPEPIRLRLQRGVFVGTRVDRGGLAAARTELLAFLARREQALRDHFEGAAAAIARHPDRPDWSLVTVHGTVAVRVELADGGSPRSPAGDPTHLLWPGLSAALFAAPQHAEQDGTGVAAPHARPAPLTYTIAAAPSRLRLVNAFTGAAVEDAAPAAPLPTRSVHPWPQPAAPTERVLGPGDVVVDAPIEIAAGGSLRILPGTALVLHPGAGIRCRGSLLACGTAAAPITVRWTDRRGPGIDCVGSPAVQFAHATLHDATPWASDRRPPALLALRGCAVATLEHVRVTHAGGDALTVVGGACRLLHTRLHGCQGTALAALGGSTVQAEHCEFAFAGTGVLARDGSRVRLRGGTVRGNLVGVRADRSARPFPGGSIALDAVACRDNGRFDLDADLAGTIELLGTLASRNPLAAERILETGQDRPPAAAPPAAPR